MTKCDIGDSADADDNKRAWPAARVLDRWNLASGFWLSFFLSSFGPSSRSRKHGVWVYMPWALRLGVSGLSA